MQRKGVETVENSETPMNSGTELYHSVIESENTCSDSYANSETDFATTVRFKAGLTARQITRFLSKITGGSGCREWLGSRLPHGYGQFHAGRFEDGRQDLRYAHRVMWELCHGPIAPGQVIRHLCDNPPCCNPDHLTIGTQADNIRDAAVQGKYARAARLRWESHGPSAIAATLVNAPRGSIARVSRETGIPFGSLAVAVWRAKKKKREATHS
jgi:hypothetical protein